MRGPVPITLTHEEYAGHPFQVGDTLTWTALDESPSKSYKLTFPKKNPACDLPPIAVVTVTPKQSFSCQAMAPTLGKAVNYTIKAIPTPAGTVSNPKPGPSSPGRITVYSAIPCKICT
jgi:hypothetical protein